MIINFRSQTQNQYNFYDVSSAQALDNTPDQFTLGADITASSPSSIFTRTVTLQGMDAGTSTSISVQNAEYSVNGGSFTQAVGVVPANAVVVVRLTSPVYGQSLTASLFVGGVSDHIIVSTIEEPVFTPSATITSPDFGQTFREGSAIPISVDVSDEGGTITRVEYYANNDLIGLLSSAPYTLQWQIGEAGVYVISAIVYIDAGNVSLDAVRSQAVTITVSPEQEGANNQWSIQSNAVTVWTTQ